jgi:hypothetical protein
VALLTRPIFKENADEREVDLVCGLGMATIVRGVTVVKESQGQELMKSAITNMRRAFMGEIMVTGCRGIKVSDWGCREE